MTKRVTRGSPLRIEANDWNEILDSRDAWKSGGKLARDLFTSLHCIPIDCEVDQATAVEVGDVVEVRDSPQTLSVALNLADDPWSALVMRARHFGANDRNPMRAKFGVALEAGPQGAVIAVAIAGYALAKVSGVKEWCYVPAAGSVTLSTGASGHARVVQRFNDDYSLINLGQHQRVWRFLNVALAYPIHDAHGTLITTLPAVYDPHGITASMPENNVGTALWVSETADKELYVIQGTC